MSLGDLGGRFGDEEAVRRNGVHEINKVIILELVHRRFA
jgi:hypothetical protein